MTDTDTAGAMAATSSPQLTMLPRDPEGAYVYWECPTLQGTDETATLTVSVEGPSGKWTDVESHQVGDALGGRFISFDRPGANHRCRLSWRDGHLDTGPIQAPRRESGNAPPAFVQVSLTPRGLMVEPAEHDHPVHGNFPAASPGAPSSFDSATGFERD